MLPNLTDDGALRIVVQRWGRVWVGWAEHLPTREMRGRTAAECIGQVVLRYHDRARIYGLARIIMVDRDGQELRRLPLERGPMDADNLAEWSVMKYKGAS